MACTWQLHNIMVPGLPLLTGHNGLYSTFGNIMVFMISTMGIVDHTMGIVDFAPMVTSGRPEKKICLLCPVSGLKGAMKGHMKTHYVFVELLGDLAVFWRA